MSDILGYLGAVFMVAFTFTLHIPFAIVGLVLMTFQAVSAKLWNLVFLNIISIVGFVSNLNGGISFV